LAPASGIECGTQRQAVNRGGAAPAGSREDATRPPLIDIKAGKRKRLTEGVKIWQRPAMGIAGGSGNFRRPRRDEFRQRMGRAWSGGRSDEDRQVLGYLARAVKETGCCVRVHLPHRSFCRTRTLRGRSDWLATRFRQRNRGGNPEFRLSRSGGLCPWNRRSEGQAPCRVSNERAPGLLPTVSGHQESIA
jgi:hypothetical protein